jgi:hypothetical protein
MLVRYSAMPDPPEKNATKEIMPDGPFYVLFVVLLLASAFSFAACIGIVRQGNLLIVPNRIEGAGSYWVSPHQNPHEFWGAVVVAGAVGAILLIFDLWMLVRHRRPKWEGE